jgi:hypothetical protein
VDANLDHHSAAPAKLKIVVSHTEDLLMAEVASMMWLLLTVPVPPSCRPMKFLSSPMSSFKRECEKMLVETSTQVSLSLFSLLDPW